MKFMIKSIIFGFSCALCLNTPNTYAQDVVSRSMTYTLQRVSNLELKGVANVGTLNTIQPHKQNGDFDDWEVVAGPNNNEQEINLKDAKSNAKTSSWHTPTSMLTKTCLAAGKGYVALKDVRENFWTGYPPVLA